MSLKYKLTTPDLSLNYYAYFNNLTNFWKENIMKNFLEKYNATKLETTKDESQLSLDAYKQRILKLLDENMVHFKNNSWSVQNRMNKLITDTDDKSVFTLRLGGKKIVRYSLELLSDAQKLDFLSDFYASVKQGDFDEDIVNFITDEINKAQERKKEANIKRREKQKQAKAAAVQKTIEAAKDLIETQVAAVLKEENTPRYMQI